MRCTSWAVRVALACSFGATLATASACGSTTNAADLEDASGDGAPAMNDGGAGDALPRSDAQDSDASSRADAGADADAATIAETGAADGGATRDADATTGSMKRVFVTSRRFTGSIDPNAMLADGVPVADQACNALATGANLGGVWRAFVSGYSGGVATPAVDHISDVAPWSLVDGVTLAFATKASFASGPAHAIDRDERGQLLPQGELAWIGVAGSDMFCNSWTSDSPNNHGTLGRVSSTTAEWAASSTPARDSCDQAHRLYCFEQ